MTKPVTFTCATRASGRRRTIKVAVYDDLDRLRADATKWSKIHDAEHYAEALGVTHSYQRITVEPSGAEIRSPAAAIIRLHRDHLRTSVVTHEATHAAAGIYRHDHEPDGGGLDDMENEEVLCYLVGEICAGVIAGLYRHGFYGERQP